ncbi:MAG: peptidase M28 [Chitinophagaceae bacterium]|nr:MAG: peptidase M28 [Chitinophagaceae bacterium]
MKKWIAILLFIPLLSEAQSKRKLRIAEVKETTAIITNLKKHVQFLASDALEGRRTGSKGEILAMEYIIDQYKQMGLTPKGVNGFMQEFEINEGKQIDANNHLKIEGKSLHLVDDYFPLAFSALKTVKGNTAAALNEANLPWFKDLAELLEENKTNPHFDTIVLPW